MPSETAPMNQSSGNSSIWRTRMNKMNHMTQRHPGLMRVCLLLLIVALSSGCVALNRPAVKVRTLTPVEYITAKRGDILTTGKLSAATVETIRVAGLDDGACREPSPVCIHALAKADGLADEERLLALSELWLQQATAGPRESRTAPANDARVDAWLEVARYSYAYLFFTQRTPGERAFEDRQTQARDYYNLAVQEATVAIFARRVRGISDFDDLGVMRLSQWTVRADVSGLADSEQVKVPRELVPAASMSFAGVRSVYRRDGFGAELVAVLDDPSNQALSKQPRKSFLRRKPGAPVWSQMPSPSVTALIRFPGESLADVLSTSELVIAAYDPFQNTQVDLHGQNVPLAANFTAGYGLWLAHSGFSQQSIRSLFGKKRGIDHPHLYLMQPYDPDKRIILMIHGLASSPEAWVNVANELMGDEELRKHFQVWQFYYPTNMPIALNHEALRQTLEDAMQHLDPRGEDPASRGMVLVGHSMGGIIARLMVSSSSDTLWDRLVADKVHDETTLARLREKVGQFLQFDPLPQVDRVVFVATPHRGTDVAGSPLGRWVGHMVRMPMATLNRFADVMTDIAAGSGKDSKRKAIPTSIENLDKTDPFIQAAADLPISPRVHYHSIIGERRPEVPLALSNDGVVPYWSSHLDGATSEKVVHSGHSVQETPQAVIELKRILREDLQERAANVAAR
jgi:pimeloyl-ACP methyl ester carboxylesterase